MATPKKTTKKTTDTKTAKKITPKEILAILKAKYDEVFDDGGVYTIKGNGKWGFADANGDVKIKPCFSALGEEWCDNIIVTYGSVDLGGRRIIKKEIAKPQFSAAGNFQKGMAAIKSKSGKWGIIDKKGKTIAPLIFDSITISGGKIIAKIGALEFMTK